MSYLNPLRLHFSGQFLAAPSTVNNDPTHYDNATFKPEYQLRQQGQNMNGWWNPSGDANWRFMGCQVKSAFRADGSPVAPDDPVLTLIIADSDTRVTGKMADLDPEQQLVSELWGVEVRIATADGATLLRSRYEVAAFMDIWDRWPGVRGDGLAGSIYQSVLTDLQWAEGADASPFLAELRRASAESGMLSIKFNVDKYDMNFQSPTFTMGRIAGTIGPAAAGEPHHLVMGRQFMPYQAPCGNFFAPAGGINACTAVVDEARGKILLDLGNALPISNSPSTRGQFSNLGTLTLACTVPGQPGTAATVLPLGTIDYLAKDWYEDTAGVVELPAGRALTADELSAIAENPLALMLPGITNAPQVAVTEHASGLFARADRYVFRLDAGQGDTAEVYATRFGRPLAGAQVQAFLDPSQLQGGQGDPPVGTPEDGVTFPASVTTDAAGRAQLPLTAGDPKNARGYIDGQVYGVRPVLAELANDPTYPFSPWHFISVLVWDAFSAGDPPTWNGGLKDVFQQFANLYPVMARFLDLGDYASVSANRNLLLLAFGLDPENPNYMPATRDLSQARRGAILQWLTDVGADGHPLLGDAPHGAPMAEAVVGAAPPDGSHEGLEGVPSTAAKAQSEGTEVATPLSMLRAGKATAAALRVGARR